MSACKRPRPAVTSKSRRVDVSGGPIQDRRSAGRPADGRPAGCTRGPVRGPCARKAGASPRSRGVLQATEGDWRAKKAWEGGV